MPFQHVLQQRAVPIHVRVDEGGPAPAQLLVLGRGLAVLVDKPPLDLLPDGDQVVARDLHAQLVSNQAQADGLAVCDQARPSPPLLHHILAEGPC
jgi:hypothetical protein